MPVSKRSKSLLCSRRRSLNQKDIEEAQDDILNSFTASATVALTRLEECLEKTTGIDFAKVKCASDRRKNLAGTKEAPSPPKRPTSSITKKPKQKKVIEVVKVDHFDSAGSISIIFFCLH